MQPHATCGMWQHLAKQPYTERLNNCIGKKFRGRGTLVLQIIRTAVAIVSRGGVGTEQYESTQ